MMQVMYTPQDRSAQRYPSTNYNALPLSLSGGSWEEDRLDKAGIGDRTFDMDAEPHRQPASRMHQQSSMDTAPYIPPLPVDESWNEGIPPLPKVEVLIDLVNNPSSFLQIAPAGSVTRAIRKHPLKPWRRKMIWVSNLHSVVRLCILWSGWKDSFLS